ncbi:MAG: hypothetical protein WCD79_05205 [Chthoniobacteraceae bacterium]
MQAHTIIFIGFCGIVVLSGWILPVVFKFKIREGFNNPSWQRVVISTLLAVFILYSLGQIDLAGVKATRDREAKKWNEDFRDGVMMTMSGISPNPTMWVCFAVVLLLSQAVLPTKK